MNKGRIFGLDLLRCIAIILVLISHSRFLFEEFPFLRFTDKFGFLGVELFFVLSGFLIGSILIKTFEKEASVGSLKTFWIRRWFRTLPNYYLFLLINAILFFVLQLEIGDFSKYLFFLQNFAWVRPMFYRESWSLCVEEWFYLLYPFGVFICNKLLKISIKQSFIWITIAFLVIPIVFRFYSITANHYTFGEVRMIVMSRLDAMMTGVIVALWKYYWVNSYKKMINISLYIGVFFLSFVLIYMRETNETFFAKVFLFNLLTIGFASLLPYFERWNIQNETLLTICIEKISLWSYSLYLVNIPVEYCLKYFMAQYAFNGQISAIGFTFLFWLISIGSSSIIYRYFETPIMSLRSKFSEAK